MQLHVNQFSMMKMFGGLIVQWIPLDELVKLKVMIGVKVIMRMKISEWLPMCLEKPKSKSEGF